MLRRMLTLGPLLLVGCSEATSIAPSRSASLAMVAPAGLALPDPLQAVGTEPFWAVTLAGGRLTYRTPDDQAGSSTPVRRSGAEGEAIVAGQLGGRALNMRITAGPCSDGMSDTVYPYTVELTIGDELRRGCARPGGRESPRSD